MFRNTELTAIKGLLDRFKALRPPQKAVIEVFQKAVESVCGVVPKKDIIRYTVATRTIGITAAGPLKSEVALHKKEILKICTDALGKHAPQEIV